MSNATGKSFYEGIVSRSRGEVIKKKFSIGPLRL
jgi:hypothetical protein